MPHRFLITGFDPATDTLAVEVVDRDGLLSLDAVKDVLGEDVVADDLDLFAGEYELATNRASALLKPLGCEALPGIEYFIGRRTY